tara:strand:+ start:706 stop:840 length:135 start_codon:yes stop_codon:yes gene_type:complete
LPFKNFGFFIHKAEFFNFDYLFFEIIAEKFQVEKIIIEILGKTF